MLKVEAEEAAGEHMRAQTSERHYQGKLIEQQASVARSTDVERQHETEYLVSQPAHVVAEHC